MAPPCRLLADRLARSSSPSPRARRRAHLGRGRPQLPRRLRRRDGDVARPLPPATRRGRAAAGRRALVHVPLLVPQRPDARARRQLREISPMARHWCFFNSSGSESVESAIHLALLYWQLRGQPGKTDLISRWPSFHGSTLGALSLSGSSWREVSSRSWPSTRSRRRRTPTSAGAARRRGGGRAARESRTRSCGAARSTSPPS